MGRSCIGSKETPDSLRRMEAKKQSSDCDPSHVYCDLPQIKNVIKLCSFETVKSSMLDSIFPSSRFPTSPI